MNQDLLTRIQELKKQKEVRKQNSGVHGYNIAVIMLTDLICCVLVGLGIGLFLQKVLEGRDLD